MSIKADLASIKESVAALEAAARELPNQHLADIIKGAHGRLSDAESHPDADLVGEEPAEDPKPFPGTAKTEA